MSKSVIAILAGSGVLVAAGIMVYVLTSQTFAGYLVSVAGVVAALVGSALTYIASKRQPPASTTASPVTGTVRAADVTSSEITGIDADAPGPRMSARINLGAVTESTVTGVRIRRAETSDS